MTYENALAQLLKEIATADRRQTATALHLGRLATQAIQARIRKAAPGARNIERARTLADLKKAIITQTHSHAADLPRWVKVFGTAQAFDLDQAKALPLNTLRAFAPLVKRNPRNETWTIRSKHRAFAIALWAKASASSAAAIAAEIRKETRPTAAPTARRKRINTPAAIATPIRLPTVDDVVPLLDTWTSDDRHRLLNAISDSLARTLTRPTATKSALSFLSRKAS